MKSLITICFLLLMSQSICSQTKFDEYSVIMTDDEFARLGNLAEHLKANSADFGTIVIYKSKREPIGHFLRHFYGVQTFLNKTFNVTTDKFSVVFGGENNRHTEMFVSKINKAKPLPVNTELGEILTERVTKKVLIDHECVACDPVVFIDEFIFTDGLKYLAQALESNPGTRTLISISRVEFLSKTFKERRELTNKIMAILVKDHKIAKNRITIHFISGDSASFYIIPEIVKNKRK